MFENVLHKMRQCIRDDRYDIPDHADYEMRADGFRARDVLYAILHGRITQRQKDKDSFELKYVLVGPALDGRTVGLVAKLLSGDWLTIITVYED